MMWLGRSFIKRARNLGILPALFAAKRYIIRRVYRDTIKRGIQQPILFKLWEFGLLHIDDLYGTEYYNSMSRDAARVDAARLSRLLIELYSPNYVIDLGCGVGRFLEHFHNAGVDTYGVDASEYAVNHPIDDNLKIDQHDLTESFRMEKTADLVLCIEVLEHLPEAAADTVVNSIAGAAPVAVVTTATPGQGGDFHVNEQPLSYWIEKFQNVGMDYDEEDSEFLRSNVNARELRWLNQNLAVYRH